MRRIAFCLAAAGLFAASAASAQTTLRFANFLPGTLAYSPVFTEYAEAVNKEAPAAVKVEMFHGGTLGPNPIQQLKLLQDGVAQIAFIITSYTPGRFPELEVAELPFILKSSREGALAFNSMLDKNLVPSAKDLRILGIVNSGIGSIHSTKVVTKPEDVKGLRLRVAGGGVSDMVKQLGGAPVLLGGGEMAEALTRGTIDGVVVEPFTIYAWKMQDKVISNMMVPMGSPTMIIAMRADTHAGLAPAAKAAVDKFAGRWVSEKWAKNLDDGNVESLAKLKAAPGHTVTEPTDAQMAVWKAALKPISDAWLAKRPENPALLATFEKEVAAVRGK